MEENLETIDDILEVETIFDLTDCNVGQKVSRPETPKGTFEVYVGIGKGTNRPVTLRKKINESLIVNIISMSDISSVVSIYSGMLLDTNDEHYRHALAEYNKGVTA